MSGADVLKVWYSSPENSFRMGHVNFGINKTPVWMPLHIFEWTSVVHASYTFSEVVSTMPYIYTEISVYVLFQEDD